VSHVVAVNKDSRHFIGQMLTIEFYSSYQAAEVREKESASGGFFGLLKRTRAIHQLFFKIKKTGQIKTVYYRFAKVSTQILDGSISSITRHLRDVFEGETAQLFAPEEYDASKNIHPTGNTVIEFLPVNGQDFVEVLFRQLTQSIQQHGTQ
jgi:hypothetical protein